MTATGKPFVMYPCVTLVHKNVWKRRKEKEIDCFLKGFDWGSLKEISQEAFQSRDNQNHVYGWEKNTSNH